MTIPAPPLPDFADLLAAWRGSFSELAWSRGDATRCASTYRLGRYALAAAVEAMRRRAGTSTITLFVPDYLCNEALERVRTLAVSVHFYPIDENLEPRWPAVELAAAATRGVSALLLVHYFGFPNDTARAADFCRRHGMALIEDAAHMLPRDGIGKGDAVVFSPHKLLPVGSCAVLLSSDGLSGHLAAKRRTGTAAEMLRWLMTRIMQKAMIVAGVSWHRRWREDGGRVVPRPTGEGDAADSYSQSLLNVVIMHAEHVARLRRENYSRLIEGLSDVAGIQPLFSRLTDGDCPYVLPLLAPGIGAEKLSKALLRVGVPALRWPDLPPEVAGSSSGHEAAKSLFHSVVVLPVHQSLQPDQLDTIVRSVREAAGRLRSP